MLYAACILCLISGVLQLIAGIKGVKHCQNPDMAHSCMIWGIVVAVFCVLGNLFYVIGGKGFDVTSLLTGLLLPALYIYGSSAEQEAGRPDGTGYLIGRKGTRCFSVNRSRSA